MNTPSSVKIKNCLDHVRGIYATVLSVGFFFFLVVFFLCVCFFNLFLFFIYLFFPKSAQAGLRLPGCTHIYGNKGFSYSIYNLYQEEQGAWEKEEGDTAPHSPAKKLKRRGNNPPPGDLWPMCQA